MNSYANKNFGDPLAGAGGASCAFSASATEQRVALRPDATIFLHLNAPKLLDINTMQSAKRSQVKDSRENIGVRGHICLYIGPMFSGKTTSMAMAVERHARVPGKQCIIVRPQKGERFGTDCATNHRGHDYDLARQEMAEKLADVDFSQYSIVGIDEGQFFPDIVEESVRLADSGKCVIIAYLDATFEAEPFGQIGRLVAKAEHVEKLSAVCKCGREASFSKRITNSTEEIVVGGGKDYVATCRECHSRPQ